MRLRIEVSSLHVVTWKNDSAATGMAKATLSGKSFVAHSVIPLLPCTSLQMLFGDHVPKWYDIQRVRV